MNRTFKKILIWTASIVAIGVLGFVVFWGYVLYSFSSGCGMNDGPFKAIPVDNYEASDSATIYALKNGQLLIDNRNDTLSPILILRENGKTKWTLDADVRNTKGHETSRIWAISNVTIIKDSDPIKLRFTGHWTYGAEAGSMEIDRDDGENSFCLSW